ncbi:MAG: ribose 5-phosphate isomerase B [Atopobiaceae bacterium]|nr:ribose 5-phosphate isomerase B [Atopobiaceae bacterium]
MKLAIGNDHTAVDLKQAIVEHLSTRDIELIDVGTNSTESFDYPISGYRVGKLVASGEVDGGILICGTGVGISLAANKVPGVRACVCSEPYSAALSKRHNDANIIAFGARVVGDEMAKLIVDSWLDATYEGGRHERRVNLLREIEETGSLAAAE